MTKLNIILLIANAIIISVLLIKLLYKYNIEKLNNTKERLIDSEDECLDKYKKKYDIILKLIDIAKNKYKIESKIFETVKELNIESIDSFKSDNILNKCYKEIIQIKEDNDKIKETKALKELIASYNENELYIISLRTYHNKYSLIYNNMIKKFPFNIISKIKKYNINVLLEGKELDNSFNNDLEV